MEKKLEDVWHVLEEVRAQTLALFKPLSREQLDRRPPADSGADGAAEIGWSLGEVFMHIAIDEIYVRELLSRPLREGLTPPESIRFLPPPPPYATPKPAILWWLEQARRGTRRYLQQWPQDADVSRTHAGGLSPMTSLGWLEGFASHEAFHHRQIDSLIGAG